MLINFFNFSIWKINITQYQNWLNILCSNNFLKNEKKFENKIIEELIFLYFNISNFEISKYRSFYISSFKILTPTHI